MSKVLCSVRAVVPKGELDVLEEADTHTRGARARGALVMADHRSRVPGSLIIYRHETLFLPNLGWLRHLTLPVRLRTSPSTS